METIETSDMDILFVHTGLVDALVIVVIVIVYHVFTMNNNNKRSK